MDGPRQDRLENLVVGEGARVLNPAYSRMVRWLRLVLPLFAVAIVVMLFTWIMLDRNTVVEQSGDGDSMNKARNELMAARFESRDSSGNPYTVTADRAFQGKAALGQDEKMIYLDLPSGTLSMEDGKTISVKAAEGRYHQQEENLMLDGGVSLTTSDGYTMETARVFIEMKDSTAKSNTPLRGEGPGGSVEALGFLADNEKGRVILKGPAKLILKPEAL